MASEPLFWCVWCEGGGNPTVKHAHFSTAKSEAQRLARMNPGRRFVVLAAAVAFIKSDLVETRFEADRNVMLDDDDLPF